MFVLYLRGSSAHHSCLCSSEVPIREAWMDIIPASLKSASSHLQPGFIYSAAFVVLLVFTRMWFLLTLSLRSVLARLRTHISERMVHFVLFLLIIFLTCFSCNFEVLSYYRFLDILMPFLIIIIVSIKEVRNTHEKWVRITEKMKVLIKTKTWCLQYFFRCWSKMSPRFLTDDLIHLKLLLKCPTPVSTFSLVHSYSVFYLF